MIVDLRLRHFRGFNDVLLKDFAGINVITGRNGTGKTAVLEGIFLNCGPGNAGLLLNVSGWRGDNALSYGTDRQFRSFFHGLNASRPAEVDARLRSGSWRKLQLTPVHTLSTQAGLSESIAKIEGVDLDFRHGTKRSKAFLRWEPIGEGKSSDGLQVLVTDAASAMRLVMKNVQSELVWAQYIKAGHHDIIENLHDRLALLVKSKTARTVVETLRFLDSRIIDIVPLSDAGQRTVMVDIGLDQLMPIFSMGGGSFNALHLAVTVAAFPLEGILLVDEVENGLHYSTYPAVVRLLIELVRGRRAQVFVATHSDEFISALVRVADEMGFEDATAFRMQQNESERSFTRFAFRDLHASRDIALEVR